MTAGLLLLALASPELASAQSGGTQGLFQHGVGARALALGSAFVAMPADAATIYWNPGALDHVPRSGVSLFYTNLLEGTSYNYVGFVQPTLNTGTFGVGVLRVGVGDIEETVDDINPVGTLSFSQIEFLLSYAKQIPYNLSIGGSIKVERQAFGRQSANAVAADIGLLYAPQFASDFLQNIKFGLTIQNVIQPELRLGSEPDRIPYNIRFGLAKPFQMGGGDDAVNFLFDVEQGGKTKVRFHSGVEYVYRGTAMLRTGVSKGDSSAQLSFGAGVAYQMFQIDYSFGKFAPNELTSSHRISVTMQFGHTRAEMAQAAEERRLAAIEREVVERQQFRRNLEFQNNIDAGMTFYQQGDYFAAYIKFSAAREISPGSDEAINWVRKAEEKLAEEQKSREEQLARQAQAEAAKQELRDFVDDQFRKGMIYFDAGRYADALQEWQRGLEREPENVKIKMWMERTRTEMSGRIAELLRRADALARDDRYLEAVQILQQIRDMNIAEANVQKDVQDKIARLQRLLNYHDLYRQGVTEYINKNFSAAVGFFAQALKLDPNNANVKKYHNDAEARANARIEDFASASVRSGFIQAQQLIQSGQHARALEILEAIQQEQRYNKRILDAIDLARERLRK